MEKVDVLILGGGLAGLSTAYHLRAKSKSTGYLVCEKRDVPGGLAWSERKDGFTFDYTGHLLHVHDPYGKKFILGLLGSNVATHARMSWIHSHGALTRYPFQANTYGLPPKVVEECVGGFLDAAWARQARGAAPPRDLHRDFERWSLGMFGRGITKHFMKPYNEKLWQTPLSGMTTEWLGRFVPQPKIAEVLYGGLCDQTKTFGYNATFRYPKKGGIKVLPQALAARVPNVVYEAPVHKVDLRAKTAVLGRVGEVRYRRLVNTLPLKHFIGLCDGVPAPVRAEAAKLRYNTVYNINIGFKARRPKRHADKHWIYFPEPRYNFYRAGFTTNFAADLGPKGTTGMYIEIARPPQAPFDFSREEKRVFQGLRSAGLLEAGDKLLTKIWMPIECGYVVYDKHRTPAVERIKAFLARRGVETTGRYGDWKYSFMEETILDGKRTAERLLGGGGGRRDDLGRKELVALK